MNTKLLASGGILAIVAIGIWYVTTNSAYAPLSTTGPKSELAYIVSIKDGQITYVHVDALGPEGEIAAARKDGTCPPAMSDNDCAQAIDITPVYDVAAKTTKTAPIVATAPITGYRGQALTIASINADGAYLTDRGEYFAVYLWDLTFDENGTVTKIDGVFRP